MSDYNGWKTFETWCVNLWLTNDQDTDRQLQQLMEEAVDEYKHNLNRGRSREGIFADMLKDWVEEMNPLSGDASMWSDLITAALGEVDWYEIAENHLEDYTDDDEDEDDTAEDEDE
jgi:hypothetical protein